MQIRHKNRLERRQGTIPDNALKALLIGGFLVGTILFAFGFWLLFFIPAGALVVLLASMICFGEGVMALQTAMVDFAFDADGVSVKYPLEKKKFYSWDAFQQVCVCYYSRATEMYGYPLICLVRKGEKKDHFGRWKTGSIFHYRNLLCLDFSEEQLLEIEKHCPYEIPDLRDKGNYRI